MSEFKKEDKKGGFWASLLSRFGGEASGTGGAAGLGAAGSASSAGSGLGAASGVGGFFATKAGIIGMILGGATIAAGIGVVYNFVGSSSKSVYTPQLFQDTYYEDQARNAGLERSKQKEDAADAASTLDMFREQAKKDGLGLDAQDGAGSENKDASAQGAQAGGQGAGAGAAGASADSAVNAPSGGGAKLQAFAGFSGAKGGGGGSSMAGGGGMAGGINGQSNPVYRPPTGQNSSMKGSVASSVMNSPKRALFNKKGAFGQAKFAGAQGVRSAGLSSAVASRTGATEAFSGETAGSGDVGSPGGGVGLGGSGVSDGNKLKNSDPSLNSNDSTPPTPTKAPEDVSPWTKYTNMALYAMIAGALLVFIASICVKKAEALMVQAKAAALVPITGPATAAPIFAAAASMYSYATYAAYAAMAAAAIVIFAGLMLMTKYGQKWTGIMYMAAGGMLMYKAYEALSGAQEGSAAAVGTQTTAAGLAVPHP